MALLVPDVGEVVLLNSMIRTTTPEVLFKTCTLCKESLPTNAFHKKTQAADGLSHRCKTCRSKNPGPPYDPQKKKESHKRWKTKNPDQHLNIWLKCVYGIDLTIYRAMQAAQGGVCAICGKPETHVQRGKVRRLCVDHDHATGKVRGLLCLRCNLDVGVFENPIKAPAIRAYLTTHKGDANGSPSS